MKPYYILLPLVALAFIVLPQSVFAHNSYVFKIGDKHYEIVIGSLNEPIVVDDKTGVDFRMSEVVYRPGMTKDQYRETAEPVVGLNESLQVELIAGDKKKVLSLEPQFGRDGAYDATFFPTIATTLKYRVFGEVNDTPFNYTFSCNLAHPEGKEGENTDAVPVSDHVTQVFQSGSYSCPATKSDLGFPEASVSINKIQDTLTTNANAATRSGTFGVLGIVLGLLGSILGILALSRRRKQTA